MTAPATLMKYGYGAGGEELDKGVVLAVRWWLRTACEPVKRVNRLCGAYCLKHRAEEALGGYVGVGEVIAAALAEGIRVEVDAPNAWLAARVRKSS